MGEDWAQPTGCTEWSVREIVAHHSGCSAGFASWAAFRRQYLFNPYRRRGEPPVDGVNRCQVRDRDKWTTADLVTELREKGPKAIRTRQRLPWLLRKLPLPFGPPIGFAPLEYLTDPIYPRDMQMHRQEICRATGRQFVQTAEHDGRLMALIMRDLPDRLNAMLGGRTVLYELSGGPAGGSYRYGPAGEPAATLEMDLPDFNWLASERTTAAEAQAAVRIAGDEALAQQVLAETVDVS